MSCLTVCLSTGLSDEALSVCCYLWVPNLSSFSFFPLYIHHSNFPSIGSSDKRYEEHFWTKFQWILVKHLYFHSVMFLLDCRLCVYIWQLLVGKKEALHYLWLEVRVFRVFWKKCLGLIVFEHWIYTVTPEKNFRTDTSHFPSQSTQLI